MDDLVEKIKKTETEAAKQVAEAEAEGKKLVTEKLAEIEKSKVSLKSEVEAILATARKEGARDAENEIEKLAHATDDKTLLIDKNFAARQRSLIEKVLKEI